MPRKCFLALFIFSIVALFMLTCTTGENPFKPQDATINLVMQSSNGNRNADTITDTVENQVLISMIGYLPENIDSAKVFIGANADTDTLLAYPKATSWADTQRITIRFRSIGTRTVTVDIYVEGLSKTVNARIVIVGRPVRILNQPSSVAVGENGSATFFVTPQDTGTFRYQWIKDGSILSGATKDTLVLNRVLVADAGRYSCVIKDQWGDSVVSQPALLTVTPNQAINHKPTLKLLSGNKTVMPGQTCTLVFTASDVDTATIFAYSILKGKPTAASFVDSTFSWTPGAADTGTDTAVFKVTDNGNPPLSDTMTVYITVSTQLTKAPPVFLAIPDTSISQGKTLSFKVQTVASAQDTVVLSAAGVNNAKLPDSAAFDPKTGIFTWTPTFGQLGPYGIVFTATNSNAVSKDTVRITVIKTDRPPVVQGQSVNAGRNQATAITLVATDPDGDPITQWQITKNPHNGTAVLADSTKGNVLYTPYSGFIGADTFGVKASDGTLWSVASANVIVTVDSSKVAPKIQVQPRTDTTVNQGGSVSFTVAINNAFPTPTFAWFKGIKGTGASLQSGTSPTYQKTNVAAVDSGNYYVIVSNFSGADTSAYSHLAVNVPPSAPTLVSPANGASGLPVSLTLVWNKVAGAAEYYLRVATDSGFTNLFVSDSTQTDTTRAITGFAKGTAYYWQIDAKGAGGTSAWSAKRKFTTIQQFSLAVVSVHGTVAQSPNAAQYDSGTVVTLTPVPAVGYQFTAWSGDLSGSANPGSIVVNGSKNITANFTIKTFALNITATHGTVTQSPNSAQYNSGTVVTLTPVPAAGYQFTGWSGDLSGSANPGSIAMNAAKNITAGFAQITYQLTVVAGTGGTFTAPASSPITVNFGAQTTITAAPGPGYKFVNWTKTSGTSSIADSTAVSTTVTLTLGAATVQANFKQLVCSWTEVLNNSVVHNNIFSIAANGNTIFIGQQKFGISQSSDNGTTWSGASNGGPYIYGLSQFGRLTLTGGSTEIDASTNNGNTWNTSAISDQVYCFANGGSTFYAGTSNGIIYSTDSGLTWNTDFASGLTGIAVRSIILNGNIIYAGTGTGISYRTSTSYNWNSLSGSPSAQINAFATNGNMVFAGTTSGIYRLNNSTGAWVAANNGLSDTLVNALVVNNNYLFAGTNSGVSVSVDNGDNWTTVNGGIPGGTTYASGLATNSSSIFMISGYSVYRSPLP